MPQNVSEFSLQDAIGSLCLIFHVPVRTNCNQDMVRKTKLGQYPVLCIWLFTLGFVSRRNRFHFAPRMKVFKISEYLFFFPPLFTMLNHKTFLHEQQCILYMCTKDKLMLYLKAKARFKHLLSLQQTLKIYLQNKILSPVQEKHQQK